MGSAEILGNFEAISILTAQMRELAAQEKWDELIALEHRCSELVERMKSEDAEVELDETSRLQIVHLIRKSLNDDAEIRAQTKDRLSELKELMQSNHLKQRLNKAYS
jgi:flagellar protein FliT